jgi:hypothetical protein
MFPPISPLPGGATATPKKKLNQLGPGLSTVQPLGATNLTPAPAAAPAPSAPASPYSIDGFQTWAQGRYGMQATPAELQRIHGKVGPAGATGYSESQWTGAQAEADAIARERGWQGPALTPPAPVQAPPAAPAVDQYARPPLELPVTDAPALNVPDLQLPENFQSPTYQAPAAYQAATLQQQDPFRAPTGEEAAADPGYDFALRESMRAIENSKAAGGALRTPGARDAIMQRAGDFATQRYGDVYNRRVGEYGMERQGNLDQYGAAREGGIDTYDRGYQAANTLYDRTNQSGTEHFDRGVSLAGQQYDAGVQNAIARYEPTRATWDARTNANQQAAMTNYDGNWQARLYSGDDRYRRERDTVGDARYAQEFERDNTRYSRSDWWRTQDQAEQRRQFLASLGLSAS